MVPPLSPRPDLAQIKRQAKELLSACKAGDASACAKLRLVPRLAKMSDAQIRAAEVGLQEAQHALAKDCGFRTWAELKTHCEDATGASTADRAQLHSGLLAGVGIRPMLREDIPGLRRFDDELTPTLATVNAQYPPGGHSTVPGGPWADDRELTEHFEKYQRHGGATLLAEDKTGRVVGFADLWPADEPEPFGRSLNVECIDHFREYYLAGLETRLLAEAQKVAAARGLPALDIGTNTCSGEYASLRRFGLRLFYEYDELLCRCGAARGPRFEKHVVTPGTADLRGLIRVNHWSPTDFTFRGEEEPTYLAELRSPEIRAIVELWHYRPNADNLPVPPNPPNRSELFVPPEALVSAELMTSVLAECAALAGELGSEEVVLAAPSEIAVDESRVEVVRRGFAFAWLRKRL